MGKGKGMGRTWHCSLPGRLGPARAAIGCSLSRMHAGRWGWSVPALQGLACTPTLLLPQQLSNLQAHAPCARSLSSLCPAF